MRAVVESARSIAAAQARHADLVEEVRLAGTALHTRDSFTGGPQWSSEMVVERQIITELAVALHQSEGDARRLLHTSEGLAGTFGATRAALESGAISYRHAEKLVQHSNTLPLDCLEAYERHLLPHARAVTVQRLERLARAAVEEAQPTTAVQRHVNAADRRRLSLDPADDGMAYLTQFLPAVEAVAIYNRADEMARSARTAGDPRTLAQLRLDTLTDLMLNGETSIDTVSRGIRARIHVTVPVLTLITDLTPAQTPASDPILESAADSATHSDARPPAHAQLEGYGPIDRLTALRLTRDVPTFTRVLTDPITGCALSYGRQRYRPPADLDELIRLTHTECAFPLSCESSATADLDHTIPWSEGGRTELSNISPLCSRHHKVKHHTEWSVEQFPDGTITWSSPAGFEYVVDPDPIAPPASILHAGPRFDNGPADRLASAGAPPPF